MLLAGVTPRDCVPCLTPPSGRSPQLDPVELFLGAWCWVRLALSPGALILSFGRMWAMGGGAGGTVGTGRVVGVDVVHVRCDGLQGSGQGGGLVLGGCGPGGWLTAA